MLQFPFSVLLILLSRSRKLFLSKFAYKVDHFFDFFQRPEIISAVELQLVLCTVRILCPGGGKLIVDEIVIFAFVDSEVNWFDSFEVSVPSLSGFCQFYLEIFPFYLRGYKEVVFLLPSDLVL